MPTPREPLAFPMSAAESETVRALWEEERFVHDVYLLAQQTWSLPVFARLVAEEAREEEALARLARNHRVEPLTGWVPGDYGDPWLNAEWDRLSRQVLRSPADALRVIREVEGADVAALEAACDSVDCPHARGLIARLEAAALRHVAALKDA